MLSRAMPILRNVTLAGAMLSACAATAWAQQPTQAQANAIRQSCRADYQAHCASVPPGGQASLRCLQEHLVDLSPNCQAAVNAAEGHAGPPPAATGSPNAAPGMSMRQKAAVMRRDCGADFRIHCPGVPLGGGQALACLTQNESRLSQPCRGALAGMKGP